ncbi:MAG: type I glyceraldehyde-3-phosphate dehydrogenase [Candidatus Daviesbacteria bacterium]|nr:type I glyceraldehyde-3-phosphate dehydrogenase [Candidatus Daviesbacteria bacterium]
MIKVAINGFGRIGRSAFKIALDPTSPLRRQSYGASATRLRGVKDQIEIVAINDLVEPSTLAHLLQHDSAYGRWDKEVFAGTDGQSLTIDNKNYPITAEKFPANLQWKDLGVDVVLECTGRFTKEDDLRQHILAGAKKVILSAPAKSTSGEPGLTPEVSGVGVGVPTYLMGVNHDQYHGEDVISNASCTTNCIAPVMAILQEKFGILKAVMTTVHAVTAEQNLVDGPPPGGKSNDLRRARAAYSNIIPTSTGAAISVIEVIPELKGKFDGRALRVPVIVGSISDITCVVGKKTTVEEVNEVFRVASNEPRWNGIVTWSEEPLVSTDIIGRSESAIVDLSLTQVVDGDLVKVFAWYDNECGYSNRLIEQVINISRK